MNDKDRIPYIPINQLISNESYYSSSQGMIIQPQMKSSSAIPSIRNKGNNYPYDFKIDNLKSKINK